MTLLFFQHDRPYPKLNVRYSGKLLSGDKIEVEIAMINEKNEHGLNDVIMKVKTGSDIPCDIENIPLYCKVVPSPSGLDFLTTDAGATIKRMSSAISCVTQPAFELYLSGRAHRLVFDEKKSEKVDPFRLLAEYNSIR